MPSLAVQLYSVFFKLQQKRLLQKLTKSTTHLNKNKNPFGITSRLEESCTASNPLFIDGVATKDIHIDPLSSISLRIFLPETPLLLQNSEFNENINNHDHQKQQQTYGGYSPTSEMGGGDGKGMKKLPVMLQFHGGGFVSGSNVTVGNDAFCRRMAKLCDVIVVAVGYRLAPESRFPAAFDDGVEVLDWLVKQASLADCGRRVAHGHSHNHRRRQIIDGFGSCMVEPWLAAHGDFSRCVLLGMSSGANIANHVARKAVEAGTHLDPVKVVAQILMYPFFIGNIPTKSEIKLSNSYFYDKLTSIMAWKLFLPENEEFDLDHRAANPLNQLRQQPRLKQMPPTLTIVAEHDWMRDRAIGYSEELRKANVDAPVLDYKDTVHEFATLDVFLPAPQARACAEDICIWVKKYISTRGHELSY